MAEEQHDALLRNEGPPSEETVVNVQTGQRSSSSNRGYKIAGFTLLACLLIAGQAVTVYFVMSQKGQITTLEQHTENLKKQLNTRKPAPPSAPKMLHMPMFNMPLLMDYSEDSKKVPMKKIEDTATVSLEKQVKDLLQDENLPQFNETFLGNLQGMKSQMEDSEWKSFESWMRSWLIFQMAQQQPPKPTPVPEEKNTPMSESGIQTKCQLEANAKSVHPGVFRPKCDEQGNYLPMQCWSSTGYCWCVDKNGDELPGTRVRFGRPQCDSGEGKGRKMALPSFPKMMELKDE
ncbi:H-2 class II histocompatibility antigen gamma chain isoform X1 [Lepisosteus oculatus]|uniref:H-2 class II histocompatibility antigen gamma chain isoform X1 n=1 Tax=Lepisosteus oculatus TaxID=7918 RepID=UPI0035F500AB